MEQQQFVAEVLHAEKQMYAIAKSILTYEADCEDAVQNAILNAYANLHTLRKEEFFRTWLIRILINECNHIVKRRKRIIFFDKALEEERVAIQKQQEYSEVYEALMTLKKSYRIPFVLYYIEGFSVKETAQILNISESSMKQRLFRARKQMKDILKGAYGYEG